MYKDKINCKAVLFDYGNTILMDPVNKILDSKGYDIAKSALFDDTFSTQYVYQFLENWRGANRDLNWTFASHFAQEEPFVQYALKKSGVPEETRSWAAPKILDMYRESLSKHIEENKEYNSSVYRALKNLKSKGKTIGVISNDREWAPAAAMQKMGVFDLFDSYYTSEGLSMKYGEIMEKPGKDIFTKVAGEMSLDLKDICYVGDDPLRDIETPKNLGMKAVLFKPSEEYRSSEKWRNYEEKISQKPDAVIEDLNQLDDIIV